MSQWIDNLMQQFGAWGVALLMLLENVFPPIPSEVVMPWAGYAVSQGEMNFFAAVTAGSVGSYAGAMFWYFLAKWIGRKRLVDWLEAGGWWLTLSRGDVERVDRWFERWGAWAVFLCRLIPGLRTLISIPAGFADMGLIPFSLYTAIGVVLWTTLLTMIGWWLGSNYASLSEPLGWISTGVLVILVGLWLKRLIVR